MGAGGDASPDGVIASGSVAEVQRARIFSATVAVVAERGVAGTSVGVVCERAGVSRRTFYERFDGLEECLVAVLDGALARAAPLVVGAFAQEGPWQDGMRQALAEMLAFFDEEPSLARVCLLELVTASPAVREHRERILGAFAALVVQRIESEVSHASPLAAEGTYASVVGIVNARLTGSEQRPLLELLGPLMGVIVGPFMDEALIAREIDRGNELAAKIQAERGAQRHSTPSDGVEVEPPAVELPALLRNAQAGRARQCVRYLAERSGRGHGPSNSEVAAAIGVANKGQISALLGRLEGCGVLSKFSHGPGRPNEWRLTPYGEGIAAYFELRENS
jgi:AcrR family transcriptional regulator